MLNATALKTTPIRTHAADASRGALPVGNIVRTGERTISGYAYDPDIGSRRLIVELLIDGRPCDIQRADLLDERLLSEGIGDGCYGFKFELAGGDIEVGGVAEVRIANTGEAIAHPIRLLARPLPIAPPISRVRWMGGLRLTGWLGTSDRSGSVVEAWLDGRLVASTVCDYWVDVNRDRPVPGFDLWLPQDLADSRLKLIHVLSDGKELRGSPVPVIAFEDGLQGVLLTHDDGAAHAVRAKVFDRIFPQSIPFEDIDDWLRRYPLGSATEPINTNRPDIAVAIIGETDVDATLKSLETEDRWTAAVLPTVGARTGFSPGDIMSFLMNEAGHCSLVLPVLSGTIFQRGALDHLRAALGDNLGSAVAFADVLLRLQGRDWPLALSAFDYERCLEQGFGSHLFAMRREAAISAIDAGADDIFRLFNSPLDAAVPRHSQHIHAPGFAAAVPMLSAGEARKSLARATTAHLRARNATADVRTNDVQDVLAVRVRRRTASPRISIVIPTRDHAELLSACIKSLAAARQSNVTELIIVDNDSSEPSAVELLNTLRRDGARVIPVPGPFNFPRLVNAGAAAARGDMVCLLNNDIEALDGDWLSEMASRLAEDDVGAVGAKLLWPSGIVQHGGVVLGPGYGVQHAFTNRIDLDPGYGGLLAVAHECSAVTAACLLTRRADYLSVGGMDELRFPVHFNDVDYCLKLRALDRRIVFTPHARLMHRASSSLSRVMSSSARQRHERELSVLQARWGHVLANDPYYSPLLSLDPLPFTGLAWPPRAALPRDARGKEPLIVPMGF